MCANKECSTSAWRCCQSQVLPASQDADESLFFLSHRGQGSQLIRLGMASREEGHTTREQEIGTLDLDIDLPDLVTSPSPTTTGRPHLRLGRVHHQGPSWSCLARSVLSPVGKTGSPAFWSKGGEYCSRKLATLLFEAGGNNWFLRGGRQSEY